MTKPIIPRLVKWFDPLVSGQRWKRFECVLDGLKQIDDFFFIQVGSNDGVVHDPLYRHVLQNRWNGILIEPVKYYFDLLRRNYTGNSRLIFENIAIAERDGYRDFFRIREGLDFLPRWTKGLGSFNRDVLMKHRWLIPNIERYIVQERVECLSFASLLKRHAVEKIDLIMIDTEGYDFEIIKQIDFSGTRPLVIVYEHKHIARHDRLNCEQLLKQQEYRLRKHFGNTLAY
ncbi:MAG: FkbM family methyltransferase [Methylococcaceae bacterium]|nr:FkbM family methyltransferase [Methylococcaceae bacterium]